MTMNTTTSVGAHQPTSVPPHLQIRTPYGDIRGGPNRTFFCMQCNAPLPYQWPNEYTAMMAAHATECRSPATPAPYDVKKPCWNFRSYGVRRSGDVFRCSMCSVDLSLEDRPIAAGDYVRWEWAKHGRWAEGELIEDGMKPWSDDGVNTERRVSIRVSAHSDFADDDVAIGKICEFGFANRDITIRRIPRPETARHSLEVTGTISRTLSQYTEYHMPPVTDTGTPVCTIETIWTKLYDGLTAEECLDRFQTWMQDEPVNGVKHRTREGGNRALTPSQLTAARELWSAQLRAKVEASEAERKRREVRVLVDLEDD